MKAEQSKLAEELENARMEKEELARKTQAIKEKLAGIMEVF